MFKFNNISSEDMGLVVRELPPISSPEETLNKLDIPGGVPILQNWGHGLLEKPCTCHYEGNNLDKLLQWLRGSGKVIFGNLKDRYYKSYIGNKIPLEQILRNKLYKFPVIFTCKPFGYLLDGGIPITITKQTKLNNVKCTYKSLPTITIKGTGSATFIINNRSFKVTNINGEITINSEKESVSNDRGEYMEGEFPYLDPGENNISWTGSVTEVIITPYWRTWI
ncbi:phage tail protein [Clostridium taeniosporum]|uniref:Phage tail protein n=1 Tax=Clostridium taeniosporum TaxID=394958 RepID=A0A1D7XLS7_9CLOT|nr:phage tail protein [Clostridium taeniosporum]AOR24298.1 phage tail protein [Clostridium taeniosporum]